MNWVSDVPSKLATLEVEDPRFQRFGAFMHQYRLGPKMSEAELSATERALQIQLPEDYRNFLLVVGNGGAGPGYGLQRFGHPRQLAERTPTRPAPRGYSITYSREGIEYPVAQFANCFDDLYWGGIESIGENASSVARPFRLVDSAYRNGWMFWEPKFSNGTIMLAGYGCGMVARLVVTGKSTGTVWIEGVSGNWFARFCDFSSYSPCGCGSEPENMAEQRPYSFGDWYNLWLGSRNGVQVAL